MDYSNIKEQFDKIISYSQNIKNPQTDKLFANWAINKEYFYNLFGQKLIYEYPEKVVFELDADAKQERLFNFYSLLEEVYGYTELAKFVLQQAQGFFDNLTVCDFITLNGKKIKAGTKLVKSFKYFAIDNRSLHDIQSEASRIIQENKVEGTLCFSIHPLDFLSLSENTYNWRSCHALDSEYRSGNLSYMQDSTTVICYLKGQDSAKLPSFPEDVYWNSKKWRTLFFLNRDESIFFAGRSYPFKTSAGLELARTIFVNMLSRKDVYDYQWTNWIKSQSTETFCPEDDLKFCGNSCIWTAEGYAPAKAYIQDCKYPQHYNDLLYSSCYKPIYSLRYGRHPFNINQAICYTSLENPLKVGHNVSCLRCGAVLKEVAENGSMLCEDCQTDQVQENMNYCDCCGRAGQNENMIAVYDGYYVCRHCLEKYYTSCEGCGKWIDKTFVVYDKNSGQYLCPHCVQE